MEPVFRDGDMVIVSPSAPIRRGDRVVVRTQRGEVMTKQLARRSARRIELQQPQPGAPRTTASIWSRSPGCTASSGRANSVGNSPALYPTPPPGMMLRPALMQERSAMRPFLWLFAASSCIRAAGARR